MAKAVNHQSQRYDFLDALRGVAALIVAFFHCALPTQVPTFPLAGFCVDLFFVLSGFVIAANYQERILSGMKVAEFMAYRAARLYPLYLIGLLLGVAGLVWQTRLGQTTYTYLELSFAFIYNLFYLPYFNTEVIELQAIRVPGELFPFNWPAWSLFFEMAINLFFVLNLRFFRIQAKQLALGAFALFALIILLNHGDAGWGSKNWFLAIPRVIFGFYVGVWIFSWSRGIEAQNLKLRLKPLAGLCMLAVGTFVLAVSLTRDPAYFRYAFLSAIMMLPVAVAVSVCIETPSWLRPAFVALGYLSYPIYCLHGAIIHLTEAANAQFQLGLGGWSYVGVTFGMSLGLSGILSVLIDEPLRMTLRKLVTRAIAPAGEAWAPAHPRRSPRQASAH